MFLPLRDLMGNTNGWSPLSDSRWCLSGGRVFVMMGLPGGQRSHPGISLSMWEELYQWPVGKTTKNVLTKRPV